MDSSFPTVALPTATSPSYVQQVIGRKSPLSSEVDEFRGIPYGVVPARWKHSSLRTKLPQDIYDASSNGPQCPQPPDFANTFIYQSHLDFPTDVKESEFDCLNLLIVRPSTEALTRIERDGRSIKLPVLVWIHGGGYGFGASTDPIWDPTRLVLRSISLGKPFIAVCINYRLNAFGFAASSDIISTQSTEFTGCNFGLRDQKVGLTWVSKNISAFGGDPTNITIGGQSAGGCSAHAHTLEAKLKKERPLFRRAIIQSGSIGCLGPISLKTADHHWEDLCKQFDLQNEDKETRMKHMRESPAADLLLACRSLNWITFPLVVDNSTLSPSTLGCEVRVDLGDINTTHLIAEDTDDQTISILIGDVDTEGSMFSRTFVGIQTYEQVLSILQEIYPSVTSAKELLTTYQITPDIQPKDLQHRLSQLVTDVIFSFPIHRVREFMTMYQPEKTDLSQIVSDGDEAKAPKQDIPRTTIQSYKVEFGNPFPGPNQGVPHHCVDLIYLFDAFHHDLVAVDNPSPSSDISDDNCSTSFSAPTSTTDSGYDSPPGSSPQNQDQSKPSFPTHAGKSHLDFAVDIQTNWINFIVGEGSNKQSEDLGDLITVYGKDHVVSVENYVHDPKWVEQRKKFDVLNLHLMESKKAANKVIRTVMVD